MPHLRLLLVPVLAVVLVFVAGSSRAPNIAHGLLAASQPERPAALDVQPAQLPEALAALSPAEVLALAAQKYQPQNGAQLEMAVWQRADFQDLRYEIEGRVWTAPPDRARLELQVRGAASARLVIVCDGQRLSETISLPGQPAETTVTALPPSSGGAGAERSALLTLKGFGVLPSLLQVIRQEIRQPAMRGVRCQGQVWVEIKGTWAVDEQMYQQIMPELRFRQVIRECRLYLDVQTLWPVRVEWWGSETPGQALSPLLQTEYRRHRNRNSVAG